MTERDRSRFGMFGCNQCFRGDYWEPPSMCGDCEADAEEREREAEEFAFWDELEWERDQAFEALFTISPPPASTLTEG